MLPNTFILCRGPGALFGPERVEGDGVALGEHRGVQEFRPGFGVGFDGVDVGVGIQARTVLEFMEEHACSVFGSIDDDGIGSTGIRIPAVDVLRFDGLYLLLCGEGCDPQRGMGEKVDRDALVTLSCGKQSKDPAPQAPWEVIVLSFREIGDEFAMFAGGVDRGAGIDDLLAKLESVKVRGLAGLFFDPLTRLGRDRL